MTTPVKKLPDGSGCFTATIMSKQEAMAFPLKDRPLNYRISSEMYHDTFEAIGEASMCWNPRPSNEVFASEQASDVAVRLCFKIANEVESKTARLQEALDAAVDLLDDTGPGTVVQKIARWREARVSMAKPTEAPIAVPVRLVSASKVQKRGGTAECGTCGGWGYIAEAPYRWAKKGRRRRCETCRGTGKDYPCAEAITGVVTVPADLSHGGGPAPSVSCTTETPAGIRPPGLECRFTVPGAPVGKPRMSQRDKWQKRPAVMRYRAWADAARAAAPKNLPSDPLTVSWTAFLPMSKSWSEKKRRAHLGTLHRQKPDRDNIDKAILDALWAQDCGVAGGTIVKRWDDGGGPRIIIEVTTL